MFDRSSSQLHDSCDCDVPSRSLTNEVLVLLLIGCDQAPLRGLQP